MDGTSAQRVHAQRRMILARWALGCGAILLVVLSTTLLVRSMTERFAPLPSGLLIVATVCFVLIADLWRYAVRRTGLVLQQGVWIYDVAATAILVLLTSAISVSGTPPLTLGAVWSFVVCHEIIVLLAPRTSNLRRSALASIRSVKLRPRRRRSAVFNGDDSGEVENRILTQRLLRWSEEGEDVVLAEFHCTFEPHERQQPIHIVF